MKNSKPSFKKSSGALEQSRKDRSRLELAARELGLSSLEIEAFQITSAWNHSTFREMSRMVLLSLLESEYGDMTGILESKLQSRREKQWAKKHLKALAPIMEKLGGRQG